MPRQHASSTDEEVNAAADFEEEKENTLGKEQSEKILTFKIIKELISEGLLTELVVLILGFCCYLI